MASNGKRKLKNFFASILGPKQIFTFDFVVKLSFDKNSWEMQKEPTVPYFINQLLSKNGYVIVDVN